MNKFPMIPGSHPASTNLKNVKPTLPNFQFSLKFAYQMGIQGQQGKPPWAKSLLFAKFCFQHQKRSFIFFQWCVRSRIEAEVGPRMSHSHPPRTTAADRSGKATKASPTTIELQCDQWLWSHVLPLTQSFRFDFYQFQGCSFSQEAIQLNYG